VRLYLLRHAHAGSRSGFAGNDFDRTLTAKGRAQVAHVESLLVGEQIDAIYTSAYVRCAETVAGIAAAHGVNVETRPELLEGADVTATLALIDRCASQATVMCSHGDVIPKVLRRLVSAGMSTDTPNLAHKGSLWILDRDDRGRIVHGRYERSNFPDD